MKIFAPKKFLQAIFNGKNFEFSKTVFTIRFLRPWKMFLAVVQKFQKIFLRSLNIYIHLVQQ